MEWIEKEASKCLKVKESWSRIIGKVRWRGAFVVHLPGARLRNFVKELLIVEFGWCKIIQIKV